MAGKQPTVGFLVWRLSMKWRAAVDRAVAPLGLTHARYSLLASLHGMEQAGEQPSQRRLSDHTGLDPVYVSKLVTALEEAGLVVRVESPSDARAVQLALTTEGRATVVRAIEVVHDLLAQLTAPLGGPTSARALQFRRDLSLLLEGDPP